VVAAVVLIPVLTLAAACVWLWAEDTGTVSPAAHGNGSDAMWLGHAWVDGRRSQSDVDGLAARVREAGIRDLFVHAGPLSHDGSLDPVLRPNSRWLLGALHQALPGVRVQAWLGDVVGEGGLDPDDVVTRDRVVASAGQVLDEGFDGVHYDLEPIADGSPGYLALLASSHTLTNARHAILSIAAAQLEPLPGLHIPGQFVLGKAHWWSTGFLHAVSEQVDQVAIMAYDSGVPFEAGYSGYLRIQTRLAMEAVPPTATLLMGVPAYHTDELGHTDAETVAASVRGVRLALGSAPPNRPFGIAFYVDFSATADDWDDYLSGWVHPQP
jgi:hypothetical protein